MANSSSAKQDDKDQIEVPGYLKFSKVIVWLLYAWVLIGVIALSLRVFLLAFSANTATGFANFVMRVSNDYLQPFRGIFEPAEVGETGYLDISAIFAIIVYLFIAWGFKSLIDYIQGKIDATKAAQKEAIKQQQWQQAVDAEQQRSTRKAAQPGTKTVKTTTTTTRAR